jgi:hypothetical protein
MFGGNPNIYCGGNFYGTVYTAQAIGGCIGIETDTQISNLGGVSSAVRKKAYTAVSAAGDEVSGTETDCAYCIEAQAGGIGFLNGILITNYLGSPGLNTSGTILALDPAYVTAFSYVNAFDLRNGSCSGKIIEFGGLTAPYNWSCAGILSLPTGSASVPAINFGTANTGIYGSSTYVETTVGNTNVLYAGLNSTVPFVGIGSVGAINNDVLASSYSANGAWGATFRNASTGTGAQTVFDFGNGTSSNEAYILLNGANVTAQNGANAMDIVGKAGVWISGSVTAGTGIAVNTSGVATALDGLISAGAAPTAAAGQIGYGGTTVASSFCGSLASAAGCVLINVAGTSHYVPYY